MATAYATQPAHPSSAPSYPGGPGGGAASEGSSSSGVAPVPDSYFTESRKGEINELRNLLRGFGTERDPQRKRDIIKKVIAYHTLGIDVSRLFTEMMLAIETRDLVIKKMIYLYLTSYARSHPELAQMCTNTLQKDCGNEDPMVRGLALRALCGLQLPSMVEYIHDPLRRGLTDSHAYVRKTAVMGTLKLLHLDPESFERNGVIDLLYDMLRDPDASVVANCVIVLNEAMQQSPSGGMALNRPIVLHLLNRLHEFPEYGKVEILELVPRYIPANEEEGYQIMNLLDPVLSTSGSAAVMATMKAFLSLAEQLASMNPQESQDVNVDLHDPMNHHNNNNNSNNKEGESANMMLRRQIIGRVKASIVTHISAGSSEMMFALLKHVETLAMMSPGVFDDEYRQFYVRYNEPTFVQYLKVEILALLANPDTAPDIVAELAETVWSANKKLSRYSIRSLARIAGSGRGGSGAAEAIARRLVEMLDVNVDHVSSEAACALALLVRKHPPSKPLLAPPLVRSLKYMSEPAGKAAVIFLIGECGDMIDEAPYALEKLIDAYEDIVDSAGVKLSLLTSTVKLFFQRPPEVQHMLGRLLRKACDDVSSQDLHDRALLYYRLLSSTDALTVESIVRTQTVVPEHIPFSEDKQDMMSAELIEEFNTLSVIYGKPSVNFIAPEYQVKYTKMPEDHPLSAADCVSLGSSNNRPNSAPVVATAATAAAATNTNTTASVDLYNSPNYDVAAAMSDPGDVDLLGFSTHDTPSMNFSQTAVAATANAGPATATATLPKVLELSASAFMSGEVYQNTWSSIPEAQATVTAVPLTGLPTSTDEVENALSEKNIKIMASGELPNEFKFFFYGQEVPSGALYLVQANIEKTADPLMIVTIKTANNNNNNNNNSSGISATISSIDSFVELMTTALS